MAALSSTSINTIIIKAIQHFYNNSILRIKIGKNLSSEFEVNKGLRHGCCLSPTLFKIYTEKAIETWKKSRNMGITLDGDTIYSLLFPDDQFGSIF